MPVDEEVFEEPGAAPPAGPTPTAPTGSTRPAVLAVCIVPVASLPFGGPTRPPHRGGTAAGPEPRPEPAAS
ncbi:hypothetical protein SCA03_03110 [Streptomyces cacaoi]|uniref:Uncharacterized protein n=1 Tax=Streptomyces cacaoi TaxID=1898 RepID=A0A4Y3QUS2_STRCI|nr:hypothetical protein SCA03_03110 [Streptomyces cacaoi]